MKKIVKTDMMELPFPQKFLKASDIPHGYMNAENQYSSQLFKIYLDEMDDYITLNG